MTNNSQIIDPEEFKKYARNDPQIWRDLISHQVEHLRYWIGTIIDADPKTVKVKFDDDYQARFDVNFFQRPYFRNLHFTLPEDYLHRKEFLGRKNKAALRIAQTLSDYRAGEIQPLSQAKVLEWTGQFDYQEEEHELVFLEEMANIFSRYYLPKVKAKQILKSFLSLLVERKYYSCPLEELNFLHQQKYGTSQLDMIALAEEVLLEEFGIKIDLKKCGGSNHYIYLDDCMFSGNRVYEEYKLWYQKETRLPGDSFAWFYLASYAEGLSYANKSKNYLENTKKIKILSLQTKDCMILNNDKSFSSKIEHYWPCEIPDDKHLQEYYANLVNSIEEDWKRLKILRAPGQPRVEKAFSSTEHRKIVETLLLKAGEKIIRENRTIKNNTNPNEQDKIKPLGFDHLKTLGFGSMLICYRNIANNCPVALWFDGSLTGSSWVPLLPRKSSQPGGKWWV